MLILSSRLPRRFSVRYKPTTLPLRALISVLLASTGATRLYKQNQGIWIGKKNKNQDGTKITLEEELKLGTSKDSKDEFQKGGRSISKWTQYHRVNIICLL